MTTSPSSFDGELQQLFDDFIQQNLPESTEVEHLHKRLIDYCHEPDPVFVVRHVTGVTRGTIYTTVAGDRLKPSDNAPAWWMHFIAFNGLRDADIGQMPTHMFEVVQRIPTHINNAGWHVAHILDAKDWNVDWRNWSRDELARRFIRNVHPCNHFYLPKTDWRRYGGDRGIIGFFASQYAARYASVWKQFLSLAGGLQPNTGEIPRYVYAPAKATASTQLSVAGRSAVSQIGVVSYSYSRLCFKAEVIGPLAMEDTFEVNTPVGTFRMTKGDFYRDFGGVVASKSYREGARLYHYPQPPRVALKYRVV